MNTFHARSNLEGNAVSCDFGSCDPRPSGQDLNVERVGATAVPDKIDVMIPMRDGVRLATTVFVPKEGRGPWPVLLERTPYGRLGLRQGEKRAGAEKAPEAQDIARQFCALGFAVAVQDCRGRYDSEGHFRKYISEAEDSFDTIRALTEMQFCDGRIASYGQSYSALVQTAVGPLNPPGLAAQAIDSGGFSNAWRNGVRQNGVVEMKQAVWLFREAAQSPAALADPALRNALLAEDFQAWLGRTPWTRAHSPLSADPDYEAALLELFDPKAATTDWSSLALATEAHYDRYAPVPILFMSSWYDPYARSISELYCGLKDRQPCQIVLGPWTHCDHNSSVSGDVDFGPQAQLDSWAGSWVDYRARFFQAAMQGRSPDAPTARFFLMGGGSGRKTAQGRLDHGGQWVVAADWPVPGTESRTLYLAEGSALAEQGPAGPVSRSFPYDLKSPVPTLGGDFSSFSPYLEAGSFDQVQPDNAAHCPTPGQRFADRQDICVFRTAPLTEDIAVAGCVDYDLRISTDGGDTDITLKLIDEYPAGPDYPEGYAMLLGDTILRLSHNVPEGQEVTGRVVSVAGTLCWTANRFAAGHRLRLDISSSNFPKFELNHAAVRDGGKGITNVLHLGAETGGCRLTLPILAKDIWS